VIITVRMPALLGLGDGERHLRARRVHDAVDAGEDDVLLVVLSRRLSTCSGSTRL
jgi:hypothetical protein